MSSFLKIVLTVASAVTGVSSTGLHCRGLLNAKKALRGFVLASAEQEAVAWEVFTGPPKEGLEVLRPHCMGEFLMCVD